MDRIAPGRRALWWSALALLLVVASWLWRLPRGPEADALNLDVNLYFYPLYEATYRRIAAGVLPTWNPYQLCGIPWLATLQGGTFYPPHVVYLILPLHLGLATSSFLHLALAALATVAFARRAGLSGAAAMVAALLFGMRGMFATSLAAPSYLEAAAWLPLGALAVLEIALGRLAYGGALLATATAMSFLAGYPQPTVYMLCVWASLMILAMLTRPRPWTTAAVCAGAVTTGVLAAGVQLLPALELIRDGAHGSLTSQAMSPFGVSLAEILLGTSMIAGHAFAWGVTALALGATALAGRRTHGLAVWALVMTAVTVVVALGDRTPLFALYRALPLLGSFRFPDRLLGTTDFVFAVAAAIGFDAVARDGNRRVVAAVALTALMALVLLARAGGAPADQQLRVVVFASAAATVILAATRIRAKAGIALVVLIAIELLAQPWQLLVTYTPRTVERYDRFAPQYRAVAAQAGADRVWFVSDAGKLQPEHALKLATRYGVRTIDDYEPLAPRRQAEYFTYFGEGDVALRRLPFLFAGEVPSFAPPDGVAPLATRRRLLDLTATRFVVVWKALPAARPEIGAFLRDAGLAPRPFEGDELLLYENPHALPRAYVVYRTRPAPPPPALLAALARPDFDPLTESYVEGMVETAGETPRGTPARIVVDAERAVEIEATLAQPGLVVLADAFYPGWHATVDGAPAPIVATNHLFRGVPAPAGTHRVRLEYRPSSVTAGALASIVGWLVVVGLAWRAKRRDAASTVTGGA